MKHALQEYSNIKLWEQFFFIGLLSVYQCTTGHFWQLPYLKQTKIELTKGLGLKQLFTDSFKPLHGLFSTAVFNDSSDLFSGISIKTDTVLDSDSNSMHFNTLKDRQHKSYKGHTEN